MWNLKVSPDGLAARIGRFGGTDLTVSATGAAPIRRRTPIADRGADLVEVRLLLCSRALLGSDVNRSIRSAGRKRVGLAPAGPD